jgi:RNA polymerase sigma-70 factor (ECF subfamily)
MIATSAHSTSPAGAYDIERLYRDYGAAVNRWATQLSRSRSDAEDIAQEVFLVAHRRRSDLPALRNPGAWLFRIATNVARHLWRHRRRARLASVENLAELPDANPTPLESLVKRRLLADLDRAMATLCERDRRVLWLCDVRRVPAARVTALVGVKPQTLRVRRYRARVQLARHLREHDVATSNSRRLTTPPPKRS